MTNLIIPISASLSITPCVALSERIRNHDEAVITGLASLKQAMSSADFAEYIESLVDMRNHDGTLWLITSQAIHKTLLERNFLPQLRAAFTGLRIRIISQG
ncbi:hypothetical protein [Sporomusa sp.]|uniref:hypothetical protein n=1 Tax=Sporomusa sp. TaxID=2078658 RepID=UPI002B72640E|nr:hypothetical protein [Sporomusa sp.]HWR06455.1 hypothetical protein [Sporomusa sp.]